MRKSAVVLSALALFLILFFPRYGIQWIGYFALLVVAASYAYARIIDAGLTVTRRDRELKTYQHQSVSVVIDVANRSILPIPCLVVTDNPGSLYSGDQNNRVLALKAGERRSMRYTIRGMNRGTYRIGPVTLRMSDPLGLFPRAWSLSDESRLVVYPCVHPVDFTVHRGLPAGSITTTNRIYEDPTRYRAVREYVAGDELRKINWKASARLGALHSTEWLPTINVPVMLLLNLTAADYEARNRYHHSERTIEAAASLAHCLAERGQPIGLISTGTVKSTGLAGAEALMPWIPVGSGTGRVVSILETLAQISLNPEPVNPVARFLERGSLSFGTRLFYLGPALSAERIATLAAAAKSRSRLRLYYTEEGSTNWRSLMTESIRLFCITEHGREIVTALA